MSPVANNNIVCNILFRPPRGATRLNEHQTQNRNVSIHAPTWGATFSAWTRSNSLMFQSTLPRGERLFTNFLILFIMSVSIHAPAWGATGPSPTDDQLMQFQSTLPRGERRHTRCAPYCPDCFNPRSRVGSDIRYLNRH